MARTVKLTWQPGVPGRGGRWKKLYNKKAYYFDGGRGSSDREAYNLAWAAWEQLKATLDQAAVKPHQEQYEAAIAEWNQLLTWSMQNGDETHAEMARNKLRDLRRRLLGKSPPPLTHDDRFLSRFEPLQVDLKLDALLPWCKPPADPSSASVIDPKKLGFPDLLDGSPRRIQRERWQDRLNNQQAEPDSDKTVAGRISRLLEQKLAQVEAKKLSAARYTALSLHLDAFQNFAGGSTLVSSLQGGTLTGFMSDLLSQVSCNKISHNYAKDRLDAAKLFVRWCWRTGAIESVPRDLDSQELRIGREAGEIRPYSAAEVKKLLDNASARTKLYILLALNTGATQVDIADLKRAEVDWSAGLITRKRSKTEKHKNVPKVTWMLWPETLRLLKAERSSNGELVLLNEGGSPLRTEELKDGQIKKNDNIRSAFARLCRKLKIADGEFKRFRKTSASMLRENKDHSHIVDLFLGHAPQSVAHRFYAKAPQQQLNEAIDWLGHQLAILS